jgi:ligand-binding sensor domain-containing protein/signal transduction histidine kinase
MFDKSILFVLFIFFNIGHASSQREIKFNKLTVEDGLSQNNINHIIQDQKGFIWFATNGGLNKFDGIDFTSFVYNSNDSNSISNNIINHLYEDENNKIWISTQNGLNVFDEDTETIIVHKNEINNPFSISHNQITCTVQDNYGNYWIGTAGGGLNKFDPEKGLFKAFRKSDRNPQSISSNYITCLVKDKYGYIWIGTQDNGLNMLDPEHEKFLRYVKSNSAHQPSISSNEINEIYEDYEGDLWIGTSAGIDLMKPNINGRHLSSRDDIINFHKIISPKYSAASKNITSIFQGASGLLWFGTKDDGLGFINKYLKVTGKYTVNPNSDFSLLSNYITSVFDDRAGILWIGTNSGISIIDKLRDRFVWHKRIPGKENTFSSNNIRSIYKDHNGILWLGSQDQGLTKYDPLTDIYTNYSTNDFIVEGESLKERDQILRKYDKRISSYSPNKIYYLTHNRINSILQYSPSFLWIGTGGGGINILNPKNNTIRTLRHNTEDINSLSSDNIQCLFKDTKGQVWVGTEDAGLNRYNGSSFKRYTIDENDIFTISSDNIQSIVEDENGYIWIGTFGGGINKFDPDNQRFIRYFYQENNEKGISSNYVYTLHYDKSNRLWIGTTDGLNVLNLDNNQFKHITVTDGLPSNTVYSILEDQYGNIWASTNKGISRINKSSLAIKNYDKEDGLQSTEFNPSSNFVTSDTTMFFGSNKGYCTFEPASISDNKSKPEIIITNFTVLNEEVKVGAPGSPLKKHISETDTLELSYKDVSISFEFVALNFTDSKKNQYAYMMENFEDKWNYVGTRRFANYTNLQPGNYIFRVKASNNDGIWNEEGKSIYVYVKPPFWNTWWFYSIIIIFISGLVILTIQLRTRALHKSKIKLENKVKQRTIQVKKQNKVLEKANKEIVQQKNEIEIQNKLLLEKNEEISNAKQKLDIINQELQDVNTNLEEKVEKRTSSLREINEELINANNELDKFIYRASHDLKGPIARLLGVSVLAKMDNKDEALKEYIELIEKGAVDINKVLNKLNYIHFINREHIQTEIIDFDKIVKSSNSNLSNYIDLEYLNVNIHHEDKFQLRSDHKLMSIILENLLENAVIFRKTKQANIDIHLEVNQRHVVIQVRDDGTGIMKEYQDKVFEMFFRGSEKSKGNGLGLYLVKKAVQKLQGNISLESNEGQYTVFTISLPKVIVPHELKSLVS